MKATPYEGVAYKYDVNSMYGSILASNMNFPYKEGKFMVLKQNEMEKWKTEKGSYFKYGIYRCTIKGDIDPVLFKYNIHNMYTQTAPERGWVILGAPNFLRISIT